MGTGAVVNTIMFAHDGMDEKATHIVHHRNNKYNFGLGLFMDRMCGTKHVKLS